MQHSILPPSSAARRVACPGSRKLESLCPQEETQASREGTAAHWAAHKIFETGFEPVLGEMTPNNEIVTQEMIDGAKLYVKDITFYTDMARSITQCEKRINITSIHNDCWGTPDFWAFDEITGILRIWDYKFGFGYVEVIDNWQLIEYAAGIIQHLNLLQDIKIIFTIVQPRCFQDNLIRRWEITASNLQPYFNILIDAEAKAIKEDAICYINKECKNCKARYSCETLQKNTAILIDDVNSQNNPINLSNAQLSFELQHLRRTAKILEARITGLEQQALHMIKLGESIPGFTAQQTYGRQKWNMDINKIIELGKLYNLNLAKPIEAITPKQAIFLGMNKKIINDISETLPGELKLVEIDTKKTRKIFGDKK